MAYYVRLLTPTEKTLTFTAIRHEIETIILTAGTDENWEKIDIRGPAREPIADLVRQATDGTAGAAELAELKNQVAHLYPENARQWVQKYLERIKTVYSFQLFADNIDRTDWPVLGRIQNCLKDGLGGIIQADSEGYYNENGDYILWQMYTGARGTIPAATLDENGNWLTFQLNLNDATAVERFQQGERPRKGFLDTLFGR